MFGLGARILGITCRKTESVVGVTLVGKYVPGVIEHDIEDDIHTQGVSCVDERSQFLLGYSGAGGKAGLNTQEILDAVTVIAALAILAILEDRGEPDGPHTQLLQIGKRGTNAIKGAPLKSDIDAVIG